MDKWGIIIFVIGIGLYFIFRKNQSRQGWKTFGMFLAGIGVGIVIGAYWAMQIVNNAINNF